MVFGKVLEGMDIINKVEKVNTDSRNKAKKDIIEDSGALELDAPFDIPKE